MDERQRLLFCSLPRHLQRKVVIEMADKKLLISLCSNIGTTRKMNQDNFYINGEFLRDPYRHQISAKGTFDDGIFAIADGMGGESNGEFASLQAVTALDLLRNNPRADYESICRCIEAANVRICQKIAETGKKSGTTIAMATVHDNVLNIYNIGDSKCLLYRAGTLVQLSKDHTVTAQMVEAGLLTKEQARQDRRSHQLFQHLGIEPEEMTLSLYRNEGIEFLAGDVLIICSDGMTDGLTDEDIIRLIEANAAPERLAKELVAAAMQKGSKDNVSVLTIKNLEKPHRGLKSALYITLCVGAAALGAVTGLLASGMFKG